MLLIQADCLSDDPKLFGKTWREMLCSKLDHLHDQFLSDWCDFATLASRFLNDGLKAGEFLEHRPEPDFSSAPDECVKEKGTQGWVEANDCVRVDFPAMPYLDFMSAAHASLLKPDILISLMRS
ncbi:hypothetical protein [Agrobacterium tumefaciens]|uniref:Uncharacterized protein n=1 Tax=Agrobacterium tumefaciens TaxID=358 RepID=A0AB36EC09_AGRTU|nr:hypothetical protein A6U91_21170 [Agrobacterium tumefaciens]